MSITLSCESHVTTRDQHLNDFDTGIPQVFISRHLGTENHTILLLSWTSYIILNNQQQKLHQTNTYKNLWQTCSKISSNEFTSFPPQNHVKSSVSVCWEHFCKHAIEKKSFHNFKQLDD